DAGRCLFRAQGSTLRFKGFTAVYEESREDEAASAEEDPEGAIPNLEEGEVLRLRVLEPKQHFTQPPPRYTEASLIKALEELGIGRPSTYASILSTIVNDRGYVRRERRALVPTELGMAVTDKLKPYFPEIMDVEFTAQMEDHLDKIEEGERTWVETVKEFYEPFKRDLARAKKEMASEKAGEPAGEPCPDCGEQLLRRRGRFGMFLACSAYPDCRYTRDLNGGERAEELPTDETCPTCGKPMVIKHGRFGKFIACSGGAYARGATSSGRSRPRSHERPAGGVPEIPDAREGRVASHAPELPERPSGVPSVRRARQAARRGRRADGARIPGAPAHPRP